MNILVVGGGGREHALVWKIAQNHQVEKIYCAPGNAGISRHAECVNIAKDDMEALKDFALNNDVTLTVVGPEDLLVKGIVDIFESAGLKIFGPRKEAARIEGSKAFAKEFMHRENIPTGYSEIFDDKNKCLQYLKKIKAPYVIKADGLAAGKGVVIAKDYGEAENAVNNMMEEKVFGEAGSKVVVEEFLEGQEVSILAICDGSDFIMMEPAQDYKKVYNYDRGPNTGGMGAYSPVPFCDDEVCRRAALEIIKPTLDGLRKAGIKYKGVLYTGLILTDAGPKVLEFNCRFGDPETQPIIKRMKSDIVELMLAAEKEKINEKEIIWSSDYSLCIVLTSGGYPGKYDKGKIIYGLESAEQQAVIFHAGTAFDKNERFVTSGGRVLGVTASGSDLFAATDEAYQAANMIFFENMHYREDLGARNLLFKK